MNNVRLDYRAVLSTQSVGIVLVIIAYVLSALLGNILAFAPSGASPFWPAAGVSLAVLMIGGLRLWPGVLLGDFIFNLLNDPANDNVLEAMAWSGVDALGPTLQAVFGAAYIARNLQRNLEGDFLTLLKTYLVGVLLCCAVSPSIGVSVLYVREFIPVTQFVSIWFSWWVGDSIGVMLLTPLILWMTFNIKSGMKANYALIAPPITLMVLVLVTTILWFQNSEKASYAQALEAESSQLAGMFNVRLLSAVDGFESLKRYISVEDNIDENKLAVYTSQIQEKGIKTIIWLPRVPHASLSNSPYVPGFDKTRALEITSLTNTLEFVPVPPKSEYFPSVFFSSASFESRFEGFDPSSVPAQNLFLEMARDNNVTVLSDALSFGVSDSPYMIFYTPVYHGNSGAINGTVEQRRSGLKGYIAGIVEPALLIAAELQANNPSALAYALVDNGGESYLEMNPSHSELFETGERVDVRTVTFFGQDLDWVAYSGSAYWVSGASIESRFFLSTALLCVLLFSLMTSNIISRSRMIREKVTERTQELSLERAKLGQALDIANILAWSIKLPEKLVLMDDRGYEFFGTNAKKEGGYQITLDQWISKFVHEDDRAMLSQTIKKHASPFGSNIAREVESRVYRLGGEVRNVIFRFSSQLGALGDVVGLLGTAQDVTQRKEMLQALKASEEYNRSIIESSQDCIKVHALDGSILDITAQGMELMAIKSREEVINVNWLKFWQRAEDIVDYTQAMEDAKEGKSGRFQGFAYTMAGEPKWWDVHISPIFDADGSVIRLLSVSRDITVERDITHELEVLNTSLESEVSARTLELADSEKRYRSMFENNPIPMWIYDDETLKFTQVNQSALDNYGYSEEEFLQMTIFDIRPEGERNVLLDRRANRGTSRTTKIEDVIHLRKDGSSLHVDITSHEIMEGNRKYRLVLSNDITERLKATAELTRQQDLTRLILENLAEGVVACDANGELILFNKAARDWHGTDPRKMPPERWGDYYSLFEGDGVTALTTERIPLVRAFTGEQVRDSEMSICREGQPQRYVVASGEPLLTSAGEKVGAVVVMHDITGRKNTQLQLEDSARQLTAANELIESERAKLAERVQERTAQLTISNEQLQMAKSEAEAASRAKSSFLAVMSHEIRTPMNGIVGMVDVLSHSNLENQHAAYVKTIKDSAFSLLGIIDDILDFSKIEASRMEMERAQINLVQVAESVVDTLSVMSMESNVSLNVFVDPALPNLVWGDPKRLRQILMNLVGNAIKFSGGRGEIAGKVRISVEADTTNKEQFIIRVQDNGIGISDEQMPRLFTSFSQAETSTTRVYGGTGLGLAISKRLVELMDGSIQVRSEYGNGSEFSIWLPVNEVAANETARGVDCVDLTGLKCVLVNFQEEEVQDLQAYLLNANAKVTQADCFQSVLKLRAHSAEEDVVVICKSDLRRPSDAKLEALVADHKELKVFLINSGRKSNPRILRPGLVSMDDVFVRQYEFLHGVAVTAGRASALEVEEVQESLHLDKIQATSIAQARAQGKLILVAEDDRTNQKVILRQLSMLGHAAEIANNGLEAWQMWQNGHYACVITDLHMPKMDGYSLTQRIREQESDGARTPILMLTANALSGEAEKALEHGVDQYLTKPLQLKVLSEALNRWVPRASAELEAVVVLEGDAVPNGEVILDLSVLFTAIGEDTVVINEVLTDYLASALKLREELFTASLKGQVDKIGSLAHRLKGSSRIVGAIRLGDLCAELENAGRADDLAAVNNVMPAMDAELMVVASNIRDAMAA